MYYRVTCQCGHQMSIPEHFRDSSFHCPACGQVTSPSTYGADTNPLESASPPDAKPTPAISQNEKSIPARMLEALLDVRTIRKLLAIGGGLFVIGAIVWLVSMGVFENKLVLATTLGSASLLLLGSGWFTTLRTKYKLAGQALTFLACVVLPLNLWFYHAQGLVRVDQNLWVGGLVCALLYGATVYRLRDPLFMYAVEVGITLTVLLLLGNLGVFTDVALLSAALVAIAAVSIHAHAAFPPEASGVTFDRKRYGMPLFWSGHAQLTLSLAILAASQVFVWLPQIVVESVRSQGWHIVNNAVVATIIWAAAAYLFFYSGLRVVRHRAFFYLAALALIAAELTLVGSRFPKEWLVGLLAVTGLAANIIESRLTQKSGRTPRRSTLGVALGILPVAVGGLFIGRIVFDGVDVTAFQVWSLTGALGVTAACSAITAWTLRSHDDSMKTHAWIHAVAAVLAVIAGTEAAGIVSMPQRATVMLAVPIAYVVAARFVQLTSVRNSLYTAAQAIAVATLAIAVLNPIWPMIGLSGRSVTVAMFARSGNPWPAATLFATAAAFFGLAATVRGRDWNLLAATVMTVAAGWQALGHYHLAAEYEMLTFAATGLAILAANAVSRLLIGEKDATASQGEFRFGLFEAGNCVLSVALIAIFLHALGKLTGVPRDWPNLAVLATTVGMSVIAGILVGQSKWRRWYWVCALSLACMGGAVVALRSTLSVWRKIELISLAAGLVAVGAGYTGRFRIQHKSNDDSSAMLLWLGSLLITVPLLCAAITQRVQGVAPFWLDELAIVVLPLLMLATGVAWQAKGTTLCGAATLLGYLIMVIVSLAYGAKIAAGIYLTVGGGALFLVGIALSVYRERLMQIPQKVADREGLFQVLDWR